MVMPMMESGFYNAAINGYLELTLLKGRQRFDAMSTSTVRCIHSGIGESSPNLFLNTVNLYLLKFEAW